MSEELIGIYLHGSMCLGSFQPSHSDLDIIVITKKTLNAPQRLHLMNGLLELHKKPSPIELSILCFSDLSPWRHPTP
ncbi:nucleotidyltransferase domain-containing protein [Lederbergia citrea]|uniref:nucleotidyltransferase domain-containing protein n=1 Tax=Lederbergia citrea TaxID=2833581 RepID=UPI001BCA1E3E|nr:nucleotidyltransferase domain-containing protein [Lederbergia citrea]